MSNPTPAIVSATAKTFGQTVLASDVPVLVDFSASWCPPCQLLKPELETLAGEVAGRVEVVVVDIDAEPTLAAHYDVTSIPDLRVFENGEVVVKASGFRQREELLDLLAPFLTTRRAG